MLCDELISNLITLLCALRNLSSCTNNDHFVLFYLKAGTIEVSFFSTLLFLVMRLISNYFKLLLSCSNLFNKIFSFVDILNFRL